MPKKLTYFQSFYDAAEEAERRRNARRRAYIAAQRRANYSTFQVYSDWNRDMRSTGYPHSRTQVRNHPEDHMWFNRMEASFRRR